MKLNPVHYDKKSSIESTDYNKTENGFIAQELQKVLPFVVSEGTDPDKILSVDYNSIIPILTKGIQEQQLLIEAQQKQIDENSINVYQMNKRGKAVKRYGRDMDFLKAVSTGETRFKAVIVEHKMISPDKKKIKLYVPKWGRMVSTWFKCSVRADNLNDETYLKNNIVLSRDETKEIDVTLYREVDIECVFMPNARNWKERVVIQIM